ncbi:MAG TPA: DUF354 domain-containing protein [Bacteroidales bacterium]|nr:DUF354 domain-containing protein [Bacteroidales bacterium]HQJ21495.1 DUF354 domain-containing protein [Bacteroidales bacterium]
MKILIDIGHPAHVHLFKNFAWEMQKKGHEILFTCREKEFEKQLLSHYGFNYISFGKKSSSTLGKLLGLIKFDTREFFSGLKFKPDIFLSHGSYMAAHAAFLLNKPHISLEDTFNFEQVYLYKPFTKAILTSDYDHPLKSKKVIRYSGYHALAYLHPKRFKPDKDLLKDLGIKEGDKYIIMRFVSWKASHDLGHKGISFENKIFAVNEFSKYAKVFISSESALPKELEAYKLNILPHRIHDILAFASLFFGESATMAEEAAMLAVPSIYIDNSSRIYTRHLENEYQLIINFSESTNDLVNAVSQGVEILKSPDIKTKYLCRRDKMLSEKIDVTAFLEWFVENWPDSFRVMKENPEYQLRFK